MMGRAVAYVRKSNAEEVAEDAKSVERQEQRAREFAERKGWTFARAYVDDNISGAILDRPGLNQLLASLEHPDFDILIVSESSRLARAESPIDALLLIRKIEDAGIRIFSYLDDKPITLQDDSEELLQYVRSWSDSKERKRAGQRSRDAVAQRAQHGAVAAGKTYGYRNVPVMVGDKHSHVERKIVPEQAAVILRAASLRAEGMGWWRIARELEAAGIPSPRGGKHWTPSQVLNMVTNPLYRGIQQWGRTKVTKRHGKTGRVKSTEPPIEAKNEAWRIIPADLWERIEQVNAEARRTHLRDEQGRLQGKPTRGRGHSRHWLSSVSFCDVCKGGLIVRHDRGKLSYFCSSRHAGKPCDNRGRMSLTDADEMVKAAIRRQVLHSDVIEEALRLAVERYTKDGDTVKRRRALEAEARKLEQEITRLTDALASGDSPSVVKAIKERESRLADVRAKIEHVDGLARASKLDKTALRVELETRLRDWRKLLDGEPELAKQMLKKICPHGIRFTPTPDGWRFEGDAAIAGLLPTTWGHVARHYTNLIRYI